MAAAKWSDGETAVRTTLVSPASRLSLGKRIRHFTYDAVSSMWVGIILAILAGAALTAGTTYALALRVQYLMATASLSSDPAVWIEAARARAYDPCYLGCTDNCRDPSYAYNACSKTATVNATGVICDGNLIWNWKDRYPAECLQALGEIYRKEDLSAVKESFRDQWAIIIVTLLGGLVGAIVVYKSWKCLMARTKQITDQRRRDAQQWPRTFGTVPWTRSKGDASYASHSLERKWSNSTSASSSTSTSGSKLKRPRILATGILALLSRASPTKAYHCTGIDLEVKQYFANTNHTVVGVVHGWYSNCYDVQTCTPSCPSGCTSDGFGGSACGCSTVCTEKTYSDKAPMDFVRDIMPRVEACGFQAMNNTERDANIRVANSGIERKWLV